MIFIQPKIVMDMWLEKNIIYIIQIKIKQHIF